MIAISIEHDLDQQVIMREVLTAMDVLADIGGFAEVLIFTSSLILSIFNYQYLNSLLASKLYAEYNPEDPNNPIQLQLPKHVGYFVDFFIDLFRLRKRCNFRCC